MPGPTDLPDWWGRLVGELRQLDDATLLEVWRRAGRELERAGRDRAGLARRDALRLQHHACRAVALERFGWAGHLERRRAAAGGG